MRILDLFSGIGGFSLAAHSLGMDTLAFCECEPYPVRVLNRHFPGVPVFPDVKELTADALADASSARAGLEEPHAAGQERRTADSCESTMVRLENGAAATEGVGAGDTSLILTAGFPCQDLSYAGKGAGLGGERSGLYGEVIRLVRDLRPDWVLLENVNAILTRGVGTVLGDLASCGYWWVYGCVPACAVGAPHRRDRWWAVAWPERDEASDRARAERIWTSVLRGLTPFGSDDQWRTPNASDGEHGGPNARDSAGNLHLTAQAARNPLTVTGSLNPSWVDPLMGYPIGYTLPDGEPLLTLPGVWPSGEAWPTPDARDSQPEGIEAGKRRAELYSTCGLQTAAVMGGGITRWPAGLGAPQHDWEPPRLTTEKQYRAPRLKALGNSIVPEVARLWLAAIDDEQRNAPATCEGVQTSVHAPLLGRVGV